MIYLLVNNFFKMKNQRKFKDEINETVKKDFKKKPTKKPKKLEVHKKMSKHNIYKFLEEE